MRDSVLAATPAKGQPTARAAIRLLDVVDQLQSARCGNAALDTLIDNALNDLSGSLEAQMIAHLAARRGACWSTDLSASIGVLSSEYNFSVGQRDGICWAWIQPNDKWQPGEFESRHDHPAGSGLIVAYNAALALTSAIIILCTRFLTNSP